MLTSQPYKSIFSKNNDFSYYHFTSCQHLKVICFYPRSFEWFSVADNITVDGWNRIGQYMVDDDWGHLYLKIKLVIKRNIIIHNFELKLSNPTTLAIAALLSLKSYKYIVFFILDQEKSTDSLQHFVKSNTAT